MKGHIAFCRTSVGVKELNLSAAFIWNPSAAQEIKSGLESFNINGSYSYLSRTHKTLNLFCLTMIDCGLDPTDDPRTFANYLRIFRESLYYYKEKTTSSVSDDWGAFKNLIKHLQLRKAFPTCKIPDAVSKADQFDQLQNNRRHSHLGPSSAEFNQWKKRSENPGSVTENPLHDYLGPLSVLSTFASDEEFLEAYYTDQRNVFDLIRKCAIKDIKAAREAFYKGQGLVANCDIEYMRSTYNQTGQMIDPNHISVRPYFPEEKQTDIYKSLLQLRDNDIITKRQHEVLSLSLLHVLNSDEVGKRLGCTGSNIRSLIRKAEESLKTFPNSTDAAYILNTSEELKAFWKSTTGQKTSFFSKVHPLGFENLLGWAYYENHGMIWATNPHQPEGKRNAAFDGAHHAHSYGMDNVRRHLGMTMDAAVAMAIIIIGETGFNISSIQSAKIRNQQGVTSIFHPMDNEEYARIALVKQRSNSDIVKAIRMQSDEDEINAAVCFQLILDMTAQVRKLSHSDELWLIKENSDGIYPHAPCSQAWKGAWHRFLTRHPALAPLEARNPQLHKIRGTAGILEWYESGGDKSKGARKINNKVSTFIRRYLPAELQEAFYRRQIRRFQNILILTITAVKPYSQQALNLKSAREVNDALRQVLADPSITDKRIRDRLNSVLETDPATYSEPAKKERNRYALIWEPEHLALVLVFSDYIKKLKLSHPELDPDAEYDGLTPSIWLELAIFIKMKGTGVLTSTRGQRMTYKRALKCMGEIENTITFPKFLS